MATKAEPHVWTDEELLALPKDGCKYEVVDGELVKMSPAGNPHERIIMLLAGRLVPYVQAHGLGDVIGSSAMYVLPEGNQRSPDLSFVAAGRTTPEGEPVRDATFPPVAPDLAVEVLSPGDSASDIHAKIHEYMASGVRLLWILNPETGDAITYRPHDGGWRVRFVGPDSELDGLDVIPGFRCVVAELFK